MSAISVYPATETPSSVCEVVAVDDDVDVLVKSGFASFVATPTLRHNGHEFRPEASH